MAAQDRSLAGLNSLALETSFAETEMRLNGMLRASVNERLGALHKVENAKSGRHGMLHCITLNTLVQEEVNRYIRCQVP